MTRRLRPRRRKGRGGFSLIELVVAMFVIVVGVMPIVALLLSSRWLDGQAQVQAAAYEVARQEMETLRSQTPANRLATTQTTFTIPTAVTALHPQQAMAGDYSIARISTMGDATHAVQQIAVRVAWTNGAGWGGPGSSVRLDTYVTQGAGQ